MFNLSHADRNAANRVTKQASNDVDQVNRSSSPNFISVGHGRMDFYTPFQKTKRGGTSINGSPCPRTSYTPFQKANCGRTSMNGSSCPQTPNRRTSIDGTPCQRTQNNCGRTSINGSPHRIRRPIIKLPVILITRKQQPGSFKAACSANGNQQPRSFGFMGNVRSLSFLTGYPLM